MNFTRFYLSKISSFLESSPALIFYGPRQVGKTTLIRNFLSSFRGKYFFGTGDDSSLRGILESQSLAQIKSFFSGYDLVVIDEAQRVREVGFALKLLVDNVENIKIIATGSSSFELSQQIGEPLTGRKRTFLLFPISCLELKNQFGAMYINQALEELLIFGSYPKCLTLTNLELKKEYLWELKDSYLLKDIFELEGIRASYKILDLLTLLA
ncbi:MAG: hypothetical protein D6780_02605, partial [Candidatus Dadabacteria bacterium]